METQLAKKAAAGSVATINLRGDSMKGAEEIKKEDISTPILKFFINYLQSATKEIQSM